MKHLLRSNSFFRVSLSFTLINIKIIPSNNLYIYKIIKKNLKLNNYIFKLTN